MKEGRRGRGGGVVSGGEKRTTDGFREVPKDGGEGNISKELHAALDAL
jgi:hypothetical protein